MGDVFLSHSRTDASFVGKVGGQLVASGFSVWIDTEGITAGDAWKTTIAQAIGRAKWVVLVVSPRSMTSKHVAAEINMAFDKGRPIIPIVHEPADIPEAIEYALAGVHRVDFTGTFEDGMAHLQVALGATRGGRAVRRSVLDEHEADARTLGRGLGFPLRVGTGGGLELVDPGTAIDDSIKLLLCTTPGERVGRPDYGCAISELAFERFDAATLGAMGERLRDAIHRWEPRADDVDVDVATRVVSPGSAYREIAVSVAYVVRGTVERREIRTTLLLA